MINLKNDQLIIQLIMYDIEVCFKSINDLIEAVKVFGIAESISALTKDDDKLK